MINLSVFQQGNINYSTALTKSFNPTQIVKMVATKSNGDSECCLFQYEGETFIVSQSVNQVSTLMIAAGVPCFGIGAAMEDNILLPFNVIFQTAAVQSVQNIGGYPAAIYDVYNNFSATSLAVGATDTVPFQRCAASLIAAGFTRLDRVLNDGTTRPIYINPNAVATISGDNYILPNGEILTTDTATYDVYVAEYLSVNIDGTADTLDSIDFTTAGSISIGELFNDLEADPTILTTILGANGIYVELVSIVSTDGVSFTIELSSPTDVPDTMYMTVDGNPESEAFVLQ